jgi:hypothetical protein
MYINKRLLTLRYGRVNSKGEVRLLEISRCPVCKNIAIIGVFRLSSFAFLPVLEKIKKNVLCNNQSGWTVQFVLKFKVTAYCFTERDANWENKLEYICLEYLT